jgi:hypothetical protein
MKIDLEKSAKRAERQQAARAQKLAIHGVARIGRLFRPGRTGRTGMLVIISEIDHKSCPMQTVSRQKSRVGLRGMWYGSDPRTIDSFGKIEWGGILPVGKTGRRISPWLAKKIS